ncbi:hypothetical protein [Rhodococcus jostii]|uniref:hypothetical protein n=1 Tax=Rhodococcus jostii TaxID=132919 RepID=UPI00363DB5AE
MTANTYTGPPSNDPHHTQRTALTTHRDRLSRAQRIAVPAPLLVLAILWWFFPAILTPWLPLASAVCLSHGIAAAIVIAKMLDTTAQILAQMPTTAPVSTSPHHKDDSQ